MEIDWNGDGSKYHVGENNQNPDKSGFGFHESEIFIPILISKKQFKHSHEWEWNEFPLSISILAIQTWPKRNDRSLQ